MATLNKKIKGIVQGPVTTGPTTQSFVKIRPGISECIAGQTDIHTGHINNNDAGLVVHLFLDKIHKLKL